MRTPLQLLFLAAVIINPALADEWSKSFPVARNPELRVRTDDASVTIRPWERGEIEARVTTSGWKISDAEVRVIERHSGNSLDLEVRLPKMSWSIGHRWVKLELHVPSQLQADIHTGDGAISLRGTSGSATLSSGDGQIEVDGLDGKLDVKTVDGRIKVRGRLDALDIRTGDGNVEADIAAGSKMAAPWHVSTGDGSITLRLPPNFAADLDARTGDGSITADLPVAASGTQRKSALRGRMNGGGLPLIMRTHDGNIRLQRL